MRITLFIVILIAVISVACGGGTDPNTNTNKSNGNTVVKNTNDPLAVVTPTPESTTNNAPTLTPVYKAYCAAWVKKDEAALRKVYSAATIAKFEKLMRADHETDIFAFIGEQVTADLCEVRNEQINGDRAIAEIKTRSYPNGAKVVFVKENGEWKLTDESPAIDAVKNSPSSNSTAGKK